MHPALTAAATRHPAATAAVRYAREALADLLESDDMSVRVRRGSSAFVARLDAVVDDDSRHAVRPAAWLAAAGSGALGEDGDLVHTLVMALAAAVRPAPPGPLPTGVEGVRTMLRDPASTRASVDAFMHGASPTLEVSPNPRARVLIAVDADDARAAAAAGHRWPSSSWLDPHGTRLPSWVYLVQSGGRGVFSHAGAGVKGSPLLAGPQGGHLQVVITPAAVARLLDLRRINGANADELAVVAEAAGLDRSRVSFLLLK